MAYEGVNNYCHSAYDWSVTKENSSITISHPKAIFRALYKII